MRILGIDPGYAIVGYGVLDYDNNKFKTIEYGAITTPSSMNMFDRLKSIYDDLCHVIEQTRPQYMAIEELVFNSNQKTAINVAQARGVILLAAMNYNLNIFEYTPLQVKQSVVGYGRAEKRQVFAMVTTILGLSKPPKPDDAAEALAIAVCHGNSAGSALSGYFNLR